MINLQKYFKAAYEFQLSLKQAVAIMLSYRFIKLYLLAAVVLNLCNWAIAIYILSKVNQSQIVLHYNVDFGVNLYDDAVKILIVPFVGAAVLFFNLVVLNLFIKKERFAVHLLLASSVVVNLFILISEAALNLINLR